MALRATALMLLAASALLGCSADAATEPEPQIETPGAFFAVDNDVGAYQIMRTLVLLELGSGQDLFVVTAYAPTAVNFDQARELARDPELPVSDELVLIPKDEILTRSWKVVWFRTLSPEERDVL
jgi:hypothetical protein